MHGMTTDDLISFYGSAPKAQKKLGITRQLFHYWKTHGIPRDKQSTIQIKTRGRIRAAKID